MSISDYSVHLVSTTLEPYGVVGCVTSEGESTDTISQMRFFLLPTKIFDGIQSIY